MSDRITIESLFAQVSKEAGNRLMAFAHRFQFERAAYLSEVDDLWQEGLSEAFYMIRREAEADPARYHQGNLDALKESIFAIGVKVIKDRVCSDHRKHAVRKRKAAKLHSEDRDDSTREGVEARHDIRTILAGLSPRLRIFFRLVAAHGYEDMDLLAQQMQVSRSQAFRYRQQLKAQALVLTGRATG